MNNNVLCVKCKSLRIFKIRIDSDWSAGAGDYNPVNGEDNYTAEELKYDAWDRPDIDMYHCLDCDHIWEN
jgi:hypothetical protein